MTKLLLTVAATLYPAAASADVTTISPRSIVAAFGVDVAAGSGFAGYLSAMHSAGVVIVAAIAVVMIVWGAVLVFGESVWGKKSGKEKIWNAVWGLLLAAGSYVILGTVSRSLLQADFTIPAGLGANTPGVGISAREGVGENRPTGNPNLPSGQVVPGGGEGRDAAIRSVFSESGIAINKKYSAGSPNHTNLDGLQTVAIDGLIQMKRESGANSITVTGGNEPGHSSGTYSHGNGYKIDVRPDGGAFDSYITQNFTRTGGNSLGNTYTRDYDGYRVNVIEENDHWDLQFVPK